VKTEQVEDLREIMHIAQECNTFDAMCWSREF